MKGAVGEGDLKRVEVLEGVTPEEGERLARLESEVGGGELSNFEGGLPPVERYAAKGESGLILIFELGVFAMVSIFSKSSVDLASTL